MNSFIRTQSGLAVVIGNKPYTVSSEHPNYSEIVDALRNKQWDDVPELMNVATALSKHIKRTDKHDGILSIDVNAGTVYFRDQPVKGVIVQRIMDMISDKFDITPMTLFLINLYNNPSNRAVEELYGWMEKNGITITEDGYLLAFKRVQNDYTSFFDSKTDNSIGTILSLPRNAVDDRSDVTCSAGLHFCSHSYLPHYHGGAGRVLLLKINPADVVSIPTDYNHAKGRACKYEVINELNGEVRTKVETRNVLPQPVITATTDINSTAAYVEGYRAGYKDGRGKKAKYASWDPHQKQGVVDAPTPAYKQYESGYEAGRTDGREKKPNLFACPVERANPTIENRKDEVPGVELRSEIVERVTAILADMLGFYSPSDQSRITLDATLESMGGDSLDAIEIVMAMEDEYGIDITDEQAQKIQTVRDLITTIQPSIRRT